MTFRRYESGISVIAPTYNCAHFIERCVATIQAQTRTVTEVIIIDDGSTDNTTALVGRLQSSMSTLKYIRQEQLGVSEARNVGLGVAKCDIVAFLDIDDTWMPTHIEECCDAFDLFSKSSIAIAKYELVDSYSKINYNERMSMYLRRDFCRHVKKIVTESSGAYSLLNPELMLHYLIEQRVAFHTSSLVIKRQRLNGSFQFDPMLKFGEDVDIMCQLLNGGAVPVYIDNLHTLYHIHSNNTICTADESFQKTHEKLIRSAAHREKQLIYCKSYNEFAFVLDDLSNIYWIAACLLFDSGSYKEAHEYFIISYRLNKRFVVLKHILAYLLLGDKGMPYCIRLIGWSKKVLSKLKAINGTLLQRQKG